MNRCNGHVALVTGAGAGIGRASAIALLTQGASVLFTDVSAPDIQALEAKYGDRVMSAALDVRSEAQWQDAVESCEKKWGRLSVLVNNAGVAKLNDGQTPDNIDMDEWRGVNAINTEGVVLGCKYALQAMRRGGGGSIINMGSVSGRVESPLAYPYGASKAAVAHITRTVAVYAARSGYNVRCNVILPGLIATEMFKRTTSLEAQAKSLRGVPFGRPGEPKDVSDAVVFLASVESRYITGIELPVDGGILATNPMRVNDDVN